MQSHSEDLGVRTSTHKFGGDTIQPIAMAMDLSIATGNLVIGGILKVGGGRKVGPWQRGLLLSSPRLLIHSNDVDSSHFCETLNRCIVLFHPSIIRLIRMTTGEVGGPIIIPT